MEQMINQLTAWELTKCLFILYLLLNCGLILHFCQTYAIRYMSLLSTILSSITMLFFGLPIIYWHIVKQIKITGNG